MLLLLRENLIQDGCHGLLIYREIVHFFPQTCW